MLTVPDYCLKNMLTLKRIQENIYVMACALVVDSKNQLSNKVNLIRNQVKTITLSEQLVYWNLITTHLIPCTESYKL